MNLNKNNSIDIEMTDDGEHFYFNHKLYKSWRNIPKTLYNGTQEAFNLRLNQVINDITILKTQGLQYVSSWEGTFTVDEYVTFLKNNFNV